MYAILFTFEYLIQRIGITTVIIINILLLYSRGPCGLHARQQQRSFQSHLAIKNNYYYELSMALYLNGKILKYFRIRIHKKKFLIKKGLGHSNCKGPLFSVNLFKLSTFKMSNS